ncbi:nudix (nucleoside diphosphate linked moiety X)-type motif 8 [Mortierella alpina]|nr:nudix (nucleoside diphosphate linked moiety X)-type motif 8 [Mortierella alpina]
MSCALSRHAQGPSDKLRHYSSNTSSTVSSASSSSPPSSTQSKSAFQYDQPFLDLVISRLSEQSDTSAYFKNCKDKALRQAGVFMPLCIHNGVPSVLFTIRASHMRNHRGEVSFPGGKRDPEDKTVLDTALREMEEEISISRDQVQVLGECAALPNKDGTMTVHPFVGIIKEPIEDIETILYNKDEVQKVFTVPFQDLVDPEKKSMVRFRNSEFMYPTWKIEQEKVVIWGLTAFILDGVLRRIAKDGPADGAEIPEGAQAKQYKPSKRSA